jgi:hypothetical protein
MASGILLKTSLYPSLNHIAIPENEIEINNITK